MFDPYADNNDFEDFFAYQMEYPEYEPQRNTRIEDYWYEDPGTEYDYMDGDEYDDDPDEYDDDPDEYDDDPDEHDEDPGEYDKEPGEYDDDPGEYDEDSEYCSDAPDVDGKNLVDFDDILNGLGKNLVDIGNLLNGLGKNPEDCSGVPDESNDGRDHGSGQCHICDDGCKDSGCNDGKYHIEQRDDFGEGESE